MAQTLWDLSPLYSSTKLDQPLRMRLLCNEAQEALKLTTPSKQTKELSTKIEKALKKLGTT